MTDCTVTTCFCRLLHHTPTLHLAVPDPSSSAHHQPGSAADDVAGNVISLAARHERSYRGPAAGRALTDCQGQCMSRRAFCSSCTRPLPPPAARARGAAAKRRGSCVLQCTIAKRRAAQLRMCSISSTAIHPGRPYCRPALHVLQVLLRRLCSDVAPSACDTAILALAPLPIVLADARPSALLALAPSPIVLALPRRLPSCSFPSPAAPPVVSVWCRSLSAAHSTVLLLSPAAA